MKHTKRIFALLLALCLLLGLCACGAGAGPVDAGAPAKSDKGKGGETPAEADDDSRLNADGGGDVAFPAAEPAPGAPERGDGFTEFFYSGSKDLGAGTAYEGSGGSEGLSPGSADLTPGEGEEPAEPEEPPVEPAEPIYEPEPAQGLVLTAAEWNDNRNWPFFTNLVTGGKISFPSFGIDPRHRLEVRVTDEGGAALVNETVTLLDGADTVLWTARTDKEGTAYLFFGQDEHPERVVCGQAEAPVAAPEQGDDPQAAPVLKPLETVELRTPAAAPARTDLQVMFIVDTTGSMGDELAYLQKDFSAIAERVGSEGVRWSVSFYRDEGDEYVTRHNEFSSDVGALQAKINAEYADGGGDEPEAVAEVLTECLTEREDWEENAAKLAFLIFDAPPHEGREAELLAAVKAAAAKGIRVIPVVASNAARETELFGRALAICTNGSYVFLTDDSGVGESHLEPIVGDYTVEKLQDLIVRLIQAEKP